MLESYLKSFYKEVKALPLIEPNIPFYLKNGYDFKMFKVFNISVLFAKPHKRETPSTLSLHSKLLSEGFKAVCVIELEEINAQDKKRLIASGVQFVVTNSVFYAPMLGVSINERVVEVKKSKAHPFTPLTQQIFLYLYYKRNQLPSPLNAKLLSERTNQNAMTVKRAIDAMRAIELIKKDKAILIEKSQSTLLKTAMPYLINPIKERFYTTQADFNESIESIYPKCFGGVDALSQMPQIPIDKQQLFLNNTYAFHKSIAKDLPATIKMQFRYEKTDIEIQLWHYCPTLYSLNSCPDPLSLYLSLKDHPDERTQIALKELLKDIENDTKV